MAGHQSGAAFVMGHAPQMWNRAYDLDLRRREGQAAIDTMARFREQLLSQQHARLQASDVLPAHAPAAAAAALDEVAWSNAALADDPDDDASEDASESEEEEEYESSEGDDDDDDDDVEIVIDDESDGDDAHEEVEA
jgi:hypothetical protein